MTARLFRTGGNKGLGFERVDRFRERVVKLSFPCEVRPRTRAWATGGMKVNDTELILAWLRVGPQD
eukprot:CAMPEP_0198213590 /NCGR_PEP_ID=MMETSP1445-20131203/28956_1 /TAXON_ID=36898 /ORGANISM="Pyramimonas sp., Strain CCMP2087" /LENGTH=65 /DNA_ID=CAMNT_0043888257 /DNA_START=869 /DNA_END=1066 /DNA_ORIENTATION=+